MKSEIDLHNNGKKEVDFFMNLCESRTLVNLMRAFAGECQAHARYYYAAEAAKHQKLPVIQQAFQYTADQEYEHAGVFLKQLRTAGLENVDISAGYPVDLETDALALLRSAQHGEAEERSILYPDFARVAREEGFEPIAFLFDAIAKVEGTHSDRFAELANLLESGQLFSAGGGQTRWVCLNCGHVIEGPDAPAQCPVCQHEQGYFVRQPYAPYTK